MASATLPKRGSQGPKTLPPHRSDFIFGSTLGEGSYSRVVHCTQKHDPSCGYAMKIMEKHHIKKEDKIKHVMLERQLLAEFRSPYIIKLVLSFHDMEHLYICMELAAGGNLLQYIDRVFQQPDNDEEDSSRIVRWSATTLFYVCEIAEALEYIHGQGVIHRDLKPESSGHIKVGDFGSALLVRDRMLSKSDKNTAENKDENRYENKDKDEDRGQDASRRDDTTVNSFMGSSEYVSPEVLRDQQASESSDYWAFGCIIFKMLTSASPFMAGSEYLIFQKILAHADSDIKTCTIKDKSTTSHPDKDESTTIQYPDSMTEMEIDLIASLLRGPPGLRLGACVEESVSVCTSVPTSVSQSVEECEEEEMRLSGTDGLGSSSDDFSRASPAPRDRGERAKEVDAICRRVRDHLYFEGVQWGHLLERPVPSSFWTTSNATHGTHGGVQGAYEGFTYSADHTA